MRFTKQDGAVKLANMVKAERAELAELMRKLAAVQVKWSATQEQCLHLAALFAVSPQTYAPAGEGFFQQHQAELEAKVKEAIAARDALLGEVPGQVRGLKDRIEKRLSTIHGAFWTWVDAIISVSVSGGRQMQGSPEFRAELESARKQAREIQDPARLIEFVAQWVEKTEEDEGLRIPLFRMDTVVTAALAVE